MKKKASATLRTVLMVALPVGLVVALAYGDPGDNGPAAKVTASVGNLNVLSATVEGAEPQWVQLASNTLHTSSQKDIFCNLSLEVGLYTNTFVASGGGGNGNGGGGGKKAVATASAAVKVRVWVDDKLALPGEVVFASRTQTLEAEFQGFIADCLIVDSETGGIILDEDCVEPETLRLVLDTTHAAAFNFLITDPGVGMHTIRCEALLTTATAAIDGNTAEASALIGKGSMTVEVVRLAQGDDIEL